MAYLRAMVAQPNSWAQIRQASGAAGAADRCGAGSGASAGSARIKQPAFRHDTSRAVRFTSPRWGEVDERSEAGRGERPLRTGPAPSPGLRPTSPRGER